jgi:hypothetical protein
MKEKKIKGRKMKQKLISLIALLAIGALLAGCLAPSEEEIEPVKGVDYQIEPAEPGWNWYIDYQLDFKIKYPTDWKNFKLDSYGGFSIDDPLKDGHFYICGGGSIEEKEKALGKKLTTPWENAYDWIELSTRPGTDVQILEMKNLTFKGIPATEALYTYYFKDLDTGEKIGEKMKNFYICAIKDKYLYELEYYMSHVKTFNKYWPTIEKMINSFEFI